MPVRVRWFLLLLAVIVVTSLPLVSLFRYNQQLTDGATLADAAVTAAASLLKSDAASYSSPGRTAVSVPSYSVPPAFVISLVQCSGDPVGFLDAAAVFLQSVHANSKETKGSGSRYGYVAYAIVHKQCEHHAQLLENLGYKTLVKDTPFQRSDIRGGELRKHIERALCCGSAEYIKLYAYTLVEHPVVLHFDLDCIILQPLDELFDAMLYPKDHPRGRAARNSISYERRNDPVPERIDAFLSMDYSTNWPWHKEAPMQGGWLVIRPSQEAFDKYIEITLEGNWTGGFNNEAGWGHLGFGGWIGSAAIQGIVAYYYGQFHRGENQNYVELDVCRYNHIGADVMYRKKGENEEKCKKYARNPGEEYDCTDCRHTDLSLVKSVHYCACKKPWTCPMARTKPSERHRIDVMSRNCVHCVNLTTCNLLLKEWFKLRRDYEDRMVQATGDESIMTTRRGTFQKDVFLDYCNGEGDYIPIAHPKAKK